MIIPPTVMGISKNSLYASSAEKRVLPDFSFGAATDWACNFNTENTVSNIISKNPKLVLGIGDYYYSDYTMKVLAVEIEQKLRIAIGNTNMIPSHF